MNWQKQITLKQGLTFLIAAMILSTLFSVGFIAIYFKPWLEYVPSEDPFDIQVSLKIDNWDETRTWEELPMVDFITHNDNITRISRHTYSFLNTNLTLDSSKFAFVYLIFYVSIEAYEHFQQISATYIIEDHTQTYNFFDFESHSAGFEYYSCSVDITSLVFRENPPTRYSATIILSTRVI